jgi:hypothetical protein
MAERLLDALEERLRDDRLPLSLVRLAAELEPAGVEPVLEDVLDPARGGARLRGAVDVAGRDELLAETGQRLVPARVRLIEPADDLRLDRIGLDGVRALHVPVAPRSVAREAALLDLLELALLHLVREVVDVVLREEDFHRERQLPRGRGRELLLDEEQALPEIVDRHEVLEVPAESIDLVADDAIDPRVTPQ